MRKTYSVVGLDALGGELTSREAFSLKEVKSEIRLIETDREYFESGLSRIQVQDSDGIMVVDRDAEFQVETIPTSRTRKGRGVRS